MLLRYLEVVDEAPLAVLVLVAAFLFSLLAGLAFHEFSHAYVADGLGDPTPRRAGRVTLDPRAHLDPVGSLLLLFVGFGWAKPTPVNPNYTRHPRQAMALIAFAGPLSNLVMAGLAGALIRAGVVDFRSAFTTSPAFAAASVDSPEFLAALFVGTVLVLNVFLAVFNLLPLAPLDGFRIAVGVLPRQIGEPIERLEPWGMGILLLLFMLPFLSNGEINPIGTVMGPPVEFLLNIFTGGDSDLRFA